MYFSPPQSQPHSMKNIKNFAAVGSLRMKKTNAPPPGNHGPEKTSTEGIANARQPHDFFVNSGIGSFPRKTKQGRQTVFLRKSRFEPAVPDAPFRVRVLPDHVQRDVAKDGAGRPFPLRVRLPSSLKATSRTQCSSFSMPQWDRTLLAIVSTLSIDKVLM